MPISILPQNKDGQELFNANSSFFATSKSEIFFVSVMRRKKREFQSWIPSNINCATSSLIAVFICSRRQVPSRNHFQRILFSVF